MINLFTQRCQRDFWLLGHRNLGHLGRLRVLLGWSCRLLAEGRLLGKKIIPLHGISDNVIGNFLLHLGRKEVNRLGLFQRIDVNSVLGSKNVDHLRPETIDLLQLVGSDAADNGTWHRKLLVLELFDVLGSRLAHLLIVTRLF